MPVHKSNVLKKGDDDVIHDTGHSRGPVKTQHLKGQ